MRFFFTLGIFAIFTVAITLAVMEAKEWAAFKDAHHCKVVAHIRGDTFNTINADGSVGIGTTPSKTGWLCDDGITYYR